MIHLRLIFFLLLQISCTLSFAQKASDHFGFYRTTVIDAYYGMQSTSKDTVYKNYDVILFNHKDNDVDTILISFENYDTTEYRVLIFNPIDSAIYDNPGPFGGKLFPNDSIALFENLGAKYFREYYGKRYKPLSIEIHNNISFSISPNPSTNSVSVQNIPLNGNFSYSIISFGGKTIINNRILNNTIDVSFLPNGNYFLAIKSAKNKTLYVEKLIKK